MITRNKGRQTILLYYMYFLTYIQHHTYSYDIHVVPSLQTTQWHKIYQQNSDIPKLLQTQKIQVPM